MKFILTISFFLLFACPAWATRVVPYYPEEALDKCISGYVVLKFKIIDGGVTVLEVVESIPKGLFDEAAVKSLQLNKVSFIKEHGIGTIATDKFRFVIEGECTPKS